LLKKNIWANFQRIIELFIQKIVTKLSNTWFWDPGSEIRGRKKPIPDPGSRGQKGTGSRIRIRNTDLDGAEELLGRLLTGHEPGGLEHLPSARQVLVALLLHLDI
jgi:hypothetical protein